MSILDILLCIAMYQLGVTVTNFVVREDCKTQQKYDLRGGGQIKCELKEMP